MSTTNAGHEVQAPPRGKVTLVVYPPSGAEGLYIDGMLVHDYFSQDSTIESWRLLELLVSHGLLQQGEVELRNVDTEKYDALRARADSPIPGLPGELRELALAEDDDA